MEDSVCKVLVMSASRTIRVRVPAGSANLGPGFDAVAVALQLYLRCTLRPSSGGLQIFSSGADAGEIPQDESNLIWRTFGGVVGSGAGKNFELEIANEIPLGRGLGSSAAAIVAGLALADAWMGAGRDKQKLIELATDLEGHPDNVAAAVLGGLVVSCQLQDGKVLAVQAASPAQWKTLRVVVVVPQFHLATEAARKVLPAQYTRADAVYNVQRIALLLAALQNGRTDLLAEAMGDRLHQPFRAALVPGFQEALKLRNVPGMFGLALSGAGPSIVAFCRDHVQDVGAAIVECFRRHNVRAQALPLEVDQEGLLVERE
jgi:homoserine kinase